MGINCNIQKMVRNMPVKYGCVGMFYLNVLCLREKLYHLLAFWGTLAKEGDCLW